MIKLWRHKASVLAAGCIAFAASGALVACGSSSPSSGNGRLPTTITIGIDGPLSGPVAAVGQSVQNGFNLYLATLKSDPTFSKVKIKVDSEDDQAQAELAVNAVTKLISEKVAAIIGPAQSSAFLAVDSLAARAKIPMISPVAATASSILGKGNRYVFLTTADNSKQATALADAVSKSGAKRVAIVATNDDYGKPGAQALNTLLRAKGIDVALTDLYPTTSQDFTGVVTKVQSVHPDALIMWGYQADSAQIVQHLGTFSGKVYGASGLASPQFPHLAGAAANGVIFPTTYVAGSPDAAAFDSAYKQKYGSAPDQFGAQAYATAQLLFTAIKKAGSIDGDALRSALTSTSIQSSPIGPLSYDQTGNAKVQVKMAQWEDGSVTAVAK